MLPIEGASLRVAVLTGEVDWHLRWQKKTGEVLAVLKTKDLLGYTAWKAGVKGIPERLGAHLKGRSLLTSSGAVEELALAAGISVERLVAPGATFHCCYSHPSPGTEQLACCGARENFPSRDPESARQVALRNLEMQETMICDDQNCASWLKSCGGNVLGPEDLLE